MADVRQCAPKACSACPWRKSNQGKPHPHGWYRQTNLRRLWSGLRTGEAPGMTCHPTDPHNAVPDGCKPAPEGPPNECTGSLILIHREIRAFEADPRGYSFRSPSLSREGIHWWAIARSVLAGTLVGGPPMPVLDDDPDIRYTPLDER